MKILAGIRRSGKSTIFEMLKQELLSRGIDESHVIIRKYNQADYDKNFDFTKMYAELKTQIKDNQRYYFILDELQEITGWEKVVNTLFEDYNTDIYVTGSNSKLMSIEISTYLTGRYILIPVYTLSFEEYLTFKNNSQKSVKEHLQDYIRYGGFPLIASGNFDEKSTYAIVEDIYNSVVLNDITRRHRIADIDLFNRVVKFVIEKCWQNFFSKLDCNFFEIRTSYNFRGDYLQLFGVG